MRSIKYLAVVILALLVTLANAKSFGSSSSSSSTSRSSSSYSSSSSSKPSSSSSYSSSSYSKPSTSSSYSKPTSSSYPTTSSSYSRPVTSAPVPTVVRPSVTPTQTVTRPATVTPTRTSTVTPSSSYNTPTTVRPNTPTTTSSSYNSRYSGSTRSVSTAQPSSSYNRTRTYSSYSRPITRTPSWYHEGYSYRFSNPRYNSGYRYYPVYCDPYQGNLNSFLLGAVITHMIMDNGNRAPIYSDGVGGAYTEINGQQVQLVQDENGNWVQLDPMPSAPVVVQAPPVQVQPRHESSGLSVFLWIFGFIAIGAIVFVVLKMRGVV